VFWGTQIYGEVPTPPKIKQACRKPCPVDYISIIVDTNNARTINFKFSILSVCDFDRIDIYFDIYISLYY
jgi:hypothetical protein